LSGKALSTGDRGGGEDDEHAQENFRHGFKLKVHPKRIGCVKKKKRGTKNTQRTAAL